MYAEEKIVSMLSRELSLHPEAQLMDYYKLYMQCALGPGHIVLDKENARNYLKIELDNLPDIRLNYDIFPCDVYFPYARYTLYLIKENLITFDDFFNAFIRTANENLTVDENTFLQGWQIATEYLTDKKIVDFNTDKTNIDRLLAERKYLVSHSRHYKEIYKPSYRVINQTLFPQP